MPRPIASGPDSVRLPDPAVRGRVAGGVTRWRARRLATAAVAFGLAWSLPGTADPRGAAEPAGGQDGSAVVAVAGPNLRAGVEYGYAHVDATRTSASGPGGTQTLRLGAESGHAVTGGLVATLPVFSVVGLRAGVHGGFREARRSLDALEPGESTIDAYGVMAELLVRDPSRGSFAVGGGYDRLEGEGGVSADQLTARTEAQIFFPDFGSGPVDWFAAFAFSHRQVAGSGRPFDVDADVYDVHGGARWYAGPDVALVLAGRWQRSEEEFFAEDDATGALDLHWRLPLAVGTASIELYAGGFAGISEYKEPPFRGDRRLLYGGRAGVRLRLFSGTSLFDSIRRFD